MNWQMAAKRQLRIELVRKDMSYKVLASKLEKMGIPETERSVQSKIARGSFSFVFFLQCMKALDVSKVDIEL